jgi:ABC-type multidrug transport system fused ATPase/permease subunit
MRPLRGHIRLCDISYEHAPGQRALDGVCVELPAESVTAIVGPSGAGKSTMLQLLLRFHEPQSGSITIGGVPMSRFTIPELRRQMSVVWQEPALVSGTLWDNLTLGTAHASMDTVDEAVRICCLEQTVADMPSGYGTPIAEWGASLSSGQRQRVAIARGVVRGTPVLLLDEATGNVDVDTEAALLRNLRAHYRGRMLVFVTHRLAAAATADHICVLDRGRLVGAGPHEVLIRQCDVYCRLLATATQGTERHVMRLT